MRAGFRGLRSTFISFLVNKVAPPELAAALRYVRDGGGPAFAPRNMLVTRELPRARVLILAPHPDDEIIGMGGSMVMHLANGSAVTVLYLTDGAGLGASRREMVAVRKREARAVGQACGIAQIFWDRRDTTLTNDRETIAELAEVIKEIRPELVYLPSFFDRHYDHFSTNAILAGALEALNRLPITVLGYEVWDNIPFHNYTVDVSECMERKRELMRFYETPSRVTDFDRLFVSRAAAHYTLYVDSRIEASQNRYAEVFNRYDAATYLHLYGAFVAILEDHNSAILEHLSN